jgi:hypothetical protein
MSQYHTAQTEFRDKESLVEALQGMGWQPEDHDELTDINSGYGQSKKAHIVVRRNQCGFTGDFGFEKVGDEYVLHRDHMDDHRIKQNTIKARYAEARVNKEFKGKAKFCQMSRSENDDEIKLRIKVSY